MRVDLSVQTQKPEQLRAGGGKRGLWFSSLILHVIHPNRRTVGCIDHPVMMMRGWNKPCAAEDKVPAVTAVVMVQPQHRGCWDKLTLIVDLCLQLWHLTLHAENTQSNTVKPVNRGTSKTVLRWISLFNFLNSISKWFHYNLLQTWNSLLVCSTNWWEIVMTCVDCVDIFKLKGGNL